MFADIPLMLMRHSYSSRISNASQIVLLVSLGLNACIAKDLATTHVHVTTGSKAMCEETNFLLPAVSDSEKGL